MVSKHVKRFSILLVIKELKIKTTIRYHCTPVRMPRVKKTTSSVCEDMGKLEPSYTAGRNVRRYSHFQNQFSGLLKS